MNTGDRVVLDCNDDMFDEPDEPALWKGMTGTVLDKDGHLPDHSRIQPDSDRPDGCGTEWFYWPDNLISKAE